MRVELVEYGLGPFLILDRDHRKNPDYLKRHVEEMDSRPLATCSLKNCPYHYSNVTAI